MVPKAMPLQIHRLQFKAMGSACEVVLASHTKKEAESLAKLAIDEVLRIERKYSRYTTDSVIAKINKQAGYAPVACDDETWALFEFASQLFDKSDGLFDITSGVLRKAWDFKKLEVPSSQKLEAFLPLIGWQKVVLQDANNATIKFKQSYRADGKPIRTDKTLVMKKVNGVWLIEKEIASN
jgi:thiamine biosynthesis lipoprotein